MIERLSGEAAVARSGDIAQVLAESFEGASQRWSAESVAATLAPPGVVALVAPGGCALIRLAADEAELLTVAVAPGERRRGLGTRLLAACLDEAAGRGAARLFLEVGAGNSRAIALYQAAGLAVTGRRRGYYAGPEGREDALLMSRETASGCPAGTKKWPRTESGAE